MTNGFITVLGTGHMSTLLNTGLWGNSAWICRKEFRICRPTMSFDPPKCLGFYYIKTNPADMLITQNKTAYKTGSSNALIIILETSLFSKRIAKWLFKLKTAWLTGAKEKHPSEGFHYLFVRIFDNSSKSFFINLKTLEVLSKRSSAGGGIGNEMVLQLCQLNPMNIVTDISILNCPRMLQNKWKNKFNWFPAAVKNGTVVLHAYEVESFHKSNL